MNRRDGSAAWLIVSMALVACGGSQPKPEDATGSGTETPTGEPAGGGTEAAPAKEEGVGGLSEDQKKQMEIALRRGGEKAAHCGEVVADAPKGKGEVQVTFDGQKGRITEVEVGSPWAGTPAEACIKRAFVGEIVMPFDGDAMVVPYGVELGAKKDAAGTPPKKDAATPPKKK